MNSPDKSKVGKPKMMKIPANKPCLRSGVNSHQEITSTGKSSSVKCKPDDNYPHNEICDVCKKPNLMISRECPKCYLLGFKKELKKVREENNQLRKLNLKLNKTLKLYSHGN